jgi:hypothetical protein
LDNIVGKAVPYEALDASSLQKLINDDSPSSGIRNADTLQREKDTSDSPPNEQNEERASSYLLDDVGAELLGRQSADVALELANDGLDEPGVAQVEDVLDNANKAHRHVNK